MDQLKEPLIGKIKLSSKKKGWAWFHEMFVTLVFNFIYRALALIYKVIYYYFFPNLMIFFVFLVCDYDYGDMNRDDMMNEVSERINPDIAK